MNKYIVNVDCALEHDGKFLVIQRPEHVHAGGTLAFPGGKFEITDANTDTYHDVLLNTAKREVFEEVGLHIEDPIQYIKSAYFVTKEQNHVINMIFYSKLEKTTIDVKPSAREVPNYYWLSYDEIINHSKAPEYLHDYVKTIKYYE